ncbi:MAG: alpha/beta hydrolase family protein, partial [Actinomycetota bacterium]
LRAWDDRNPAGLDADAEAAYALLGNRDPAGFEALFAALPPRVREEFAAVSPAGVAGGVRVPVFALHDDGDPASPPAESRLLVEALGGRARLTEIGLFDHVRPEGALPEQFGDGIRLARFAARLLRVQEGWPRP